MLEQQQGQLVTGLQEMYHRLLKGESWNGPTLSEANGHPLTHDILAAMNLLESKHDGSGDMEAFEEDCQKLQSRLLADGAGYVKRRQSFSSDSDHSQCGPSRSTSQNTPTITKPTMFKENFSFSASPTPLPQSPAPKKRQSYPPAQQSPLHQSTPLTNDPQLYQPEWTLPDLSNPEALLRSKFALQAPQLPNSLDDVEDIMNSPQWDDSTAAFDLNMNSWTSFPQQLSPGFGLQGMPDFGVNLSDPMDVDFSKYIQVAT